MKASIKHDILLTFLILLCISFVIVCLGCTLEEGLIGDDDFEKTTPFSADDIKAFENIYQVKFPQGTQFIQFRRSSDSIFTNDTIATLDITLPDAQRDAFASDWFQRNSVHIQSLDQYFKENNNILLLSKSYANHSGDDILYRFRDQSIRKNAFRFFSSGYGWFICIVTIFVTNFLFKKFSREDVVLWTPPD